jgi:hypothetical protein
MLNLRQRVLSKKHVYRLKKRYESVELIELIRKEIGIKWLLNKKVI